MRGGEMCRKARRERMAPVKLTEAIGIGHPVEPVACKNVHKILIGGVCVRHCRSGERCGWGEVAGQGPAHERAPGALTLGLEGERAHEGCRDLKRTLHTTTKDLVLVDRELCPLRRTL